VSAPHLVDVLAAVSCVRFHTPLLFVSPSPWPTPLTPNLFTPFERIDFFNHLLVTDVDRPFPSRETHSSPYHFFSILQWCYGLHVGKETFGPRPPPRCLRFRPILIPPDKVYLCASFPPPLLPTNPPSPQGRLMFFPYKSFI